MKKFIMSFAAVAVVALLTACGGDSAKYTNFVDDEKGFSFDVPEGLEKFNGPEAMGATEFRLNGKITDGVSANVKQSWDGEYTQEKIDAEFAEATLSLSGTPESKEKTADGYVFTESFKDMGRNGMQKAIFKGDKKYTITVYWSDENASKYGGDVAKHIIESFKVTK